ncbi:SRPBCC family protein [Jannaschia pohangensis]|uniref:Carbon monoxide dehydrogenase subunit G n=1 Tax=Jannaschia pohangensis TaxID=390807 RepID=A0A1I3MCI8_9RHOB|nr:SRPBCC family protein [Jannaschia pohangensis]SFI94435.1 Carbon monoxide dehydrogenase subunit G [Jannaschia pohangensis]
MKFVATEDIAAPIDVVWARVSDLEGFEARARDRVTGLVRTPPGPAAQGSKWTGRAEVMGKTREVTVTAEALDAPNRLMAAAATDGMDVTIDVVLESLAPARTRLTVTTEAKAKTLTARLMLQSAKLARQAMAKRYKARVANFAARVEKAAG